jgi:anti-sigma regulatory factor (Ser/Thr protein kinase)/cell division protein FtsL
MLWLKKIPLKTTLLFLVVLITLNFVYYQHSKSILIQNQKDKMLLLYSSVRTNIEQTAAGEKSVEDLIGQNLRAAAIAAQHKLNPDIDKVDNRELVELSKLLGVDHITLFKRTSDDIIGAKSSDPKEINISSKGWDTVYAALNQLFDLLEVQVGMGQTLPHYWSEPFDTATSDQETVNKWGFYYDGSTNYIIDPYVHDTAFRAYQSTTGVNDLIRRLTKEYKDMGLEISILNTNKLLERQAAGSNPTPSNWHSERLVTFGDYKYRDADEKIYAQQALDSDQTVFYTTSSQGKTVFKSFTPIHLENLKYNALGEAPLIEVSSDYTQIERQLRHQLNQTLLFMLLCSCLSLAIMTVILMMYNRNKELAVQNVQETYVGNIETLFQSIREQRHDFINHIQTIHAFLTLKHYEEGQAYTKALVGEIRVINDLVNINNPPLIALMQAKLTQGECQEICFEHAFNQMEKLKLSPVKATDIVRIVSNLIDNAFDATMELEPEERYVRVEGDVISNHLQLKVVNSGNTIPVHIQERLFQSGFTSKLNGKNSGLGLHIVKQLAKRYNGSVNFKSEEGLTEFVISIPLGKL